jgi:hypothetical protein
MAPLTRSRNKQLQQFLKQAHMAAQTVSKEIQDVYVSSYDKARIFQEILERSSGLTIYEIQEKIGVGFNNLHFLMFCFQAKNNFCKHIVPRCFEDCPRLWELNKTIWQQEFQRIMNL